jgi:predicted glycosyltransferase involved in capsule biosynthesis
MGCEIRKQNAIISWKELKKMINFFKEKQILVDCHLFEFGEEFTFDDSIKIKMKIDYYERSSKINIVINHELNKNSDFISIMDSDLFFVEDQYESLINDVRYLEEQKEKIFYTYNLLDIDEYSRNEIIDHTTLSLNYNIIKKNTPRFSWRHSFGAGTLGGIFICHTDDLKKMGGFNENFLTWGGEDDDAKQRINQFSSWVPKMFQGPYHLYHPKNLEDKKYYIPVYSDEFYNINKINKVR